MAKRSKRTSAAKSVRRSKRTASRMSVKRSGGGSGRRTSLHTPLSMPSLESVSPVSIQPGVPYVDTLPCLLPIGRNRGNKRCPYSYDIMMNQRNQTTPDSQRNMRKKTRRTVPNDSHDPSPPPELDFPDPDPGPRSPQYRVHLLPRKAHNRLIAPYSADRMALKRRITTPESQHRLRKLTKAEKEMKRLGKHFKEVDAFQLDVD